MDSEMSGVAQDETALTGKPGDGVPPSAGAETPAVRESHDVAADLEVESAPARPHLRLVADNSDGRGGRDAEADPERAGPTNVTDDRSGLRSGALLRTTRENRGLSIEQVSQETRIRMDHLRAIEDMMPGLVGAKVYVEGHIRTYARHLGLNPEEVLSQYRRESAILSDPEKVEMAPPPATRRLRPSAPVLGLLVVALTGAGAAALLMNLPSGGETRGTAPAAAAPSPEPTAAAAAAPPLRIVALKQARIEIRGADGTKFIGREFQPGETYAPRVGAGWTVSTDQGDAFEWRLGDTITLGLFAPQGGPVNYQSVDMALERQPVVIATLPVEDPAAAAYPDAPEAPANPRPAPARVSGEAARASPTAPAPRRPTPRPAANVPPSSSAAPAPAPAPTTPDPALAAYPEAPPAPPAGEPLPQ